MKSIKAKHNTVLLPSGKDEVRIKTRNEAELHFESEMKQVALKHDSLIDREDYDRDTLPNSESMKGEFHVPLHVSKVADLAFALRLLISSCAVASFHHAFHTMYVRRRHGEVPS